MFNPLFSSACVHARAHVHAQVCFLRMPNSTFQAILYSLYIFSMLKLKVIQRRDRDKDRFTSIFYSKMEILKCHLQDDNHLCRQAYIQGLRMSASRRNPSASFPAPTSAQTQDLCEKG